MPAYHVNVAVKIFDGVFVRETLRLVSPETPSLARADGAAFRTLTKCEI